MSFRVSASPKTPLTPAVSFTPVYNDLLQRRCAWDGAPSPTGECGEGRERRLLPKMQDGAFRTRNKPDVPAIVHEVLRSPGQPIDLAPRGFMERRFGHDFSRVRVHTNENAARSAQVLEARAYTVGRHVVFGAGQYAPHTRAGQQLLAHELTHVTQSPNASATSEIKIGRPDSAEERTAEHNEATFHPARPAAASCGALQLQRKSTIGAFFGDIGRGIASFFTGSEPAYDKQTLLNYLKYITDNKGIENDYDSDNKARAVVARWKKGEAAFELMPEQKMVLIKEMQSGFTGDDDEQAILDLLENSGNGDLRIIFRVGGINVKDLNDDFHGEEWRRLKAFYQARFNGGMAALLKGNVEPVGTAGGGAPQFSYRWNVLKAKINGPYTIDEIVADLDTLSKSDKDRAVKDLAAERVKQDRAIREPLRKLVESFKAATDQLTKDSLKKQYDALNAPVIRLDTILQTVSKDIALGETQSALSSETKVPTAGEKTQIQEALKPDLKKDVTGTVLPFTDKLPGETKTYIEKLRDFMPTMIQGYFDKMVANRGPTEHGDPTKVHQLKELEDIGNVSKEETDKVFGEFYDKSAHPALKADKPGQRGNIHDLWQDTQDELAVMNRDQRRAKARALMFYFFESNRTVLSMNFDHNADPKFNQVGGRKVPVNDEAKALDSLATEFTRTNAQIKKLNEIDRGWDASAGGGEINIQLFKPDTPDKDRDFLWDMFQTLIHEYLHTLAHKDYNTFAENLPSPNQTNTLVEGVDSLLDEIVWTHVQPRVTTTTLREKVEGPVYSKLPPIDVKPASRRRYASYTQAVKLANIVGIRNIYAAYFMGQVNKIGG
jgi:hypothetical protein